MEERQDYTAVFRDAGAVDKYEHVTYAPDSYAWHVDARQRAYLRAVVRRAFPNRPPVQHDFACGTGRAVRALHGLVRDAHGYDTSADMLAKAAEVGARAHWHHVSATGPVPAPATAARPAIVTMLRLLLNVDDAVRDRALGFAARALPDARAGLLVVENHGQTRSLRHLRAARHRGRRWFAELSHDEVGSLLGRHGFTVVARRGFSMLTPRWYDQRGLRTAARALDATAARMPGAAALAVNVLYVARRA